jgi:hypothetical protein
MSELGVCFTAFGAPYLAMALTSSLSLRATNPNVPICMVTNVTDRTPDVSWWSPARGDVWLPVERDTVDNRLAKVDVYGYSPFPKTLFLDCDTFVVGRLERVDQFLDHFDVLLRPAAFPCPTDGGHRILNLVETGGVKVPDQIIHGALRRHAVACFCAR